MIRITGRRICEIIAAKLISILRPDIAGKLGALDIRFMNISFSQFGEDFIVYTFLKDMEREKGIYIDVGAHHPFEYSNTCLLYHKGWRGINIDLFEEKINRFHTYRPDDINVVAAISNKQEIVNRLHYSVSVMNRIAPLSDTNEQSLWGESPLEKKEMETTTLTHILDGIYTKPPKIDFLTIDCEGQDFEVLQGLDLTIYKPEIIAVETTYDNCAQAAFSSYLEHYGYQLYGMTKLTSIYGRRAPSVDHAGN